MALRDAIYSRLSNFSALTSLVSTRIYSKEITQDTNKPCVYFEVLSIERITAINGDSGMCEAQLRVISIGSTLSIAVAVSTQVQAALQRYSGTISSTDIRDISIDGESDSYEADLDESNVEQYFTVSYIE